ncbi:NUDIX domain-containing protein [Micromonospora sp. NPDC051141]|uniref:NUDIX domain-containing protein n=1 Tax=Micromonospora sp. NPDC051141 TaxID=3364284 RepID=UPI0037A093A5
MTDLRAYTHPEVYLGVRQGWADPQYDPTRIDWPARQAAAAIPFRVVNGRPVNPVERTDIRYGRNRLGHWGEAQCADAAVTTTDTTGGRWIVMIERRDGGGWALPGGHIEPGETPLAAAGRELTEETGLVVDLTDPWVRTLPTRYVPDPRCSDEAWMVTHLTTVSLGVYEPDSLPPLVAGDDAARAAWVRATSYADLARHLATAYDGIVFSAHQPMLTDLLGTPAWPTITTTAEINGIALADIGEDGDIIALGHHHPARLLPALRRYALEIWGEALNPADPAHPHEQIHHEWVVNTGDKIPGLQQEWCLEAAPADALGAFPVTRWCEQCAAGSSAGTRRAASRR